MVPQYLVKKIEMMGVVSKFKGLAREGKKEGNCKASKWAVGWNGPESHLSLFALYKHYYYYVYGCYPIILYSTFLLLLYYYFTCSFCLFFSWSLEHFSFHLYMHAYFSTYLDRWTQVAVCLTIGLFGLFIMHIQISADAWYREILLANKENKYKCILQEIMCI